MPQTRLIERLDAVLGPQGLLAGSDISNRYARDMSGLPACGPALVLRPQSTQELSSALAVCHELRQPLVVQGGLTGLCGGATPRTGEVALSLERLNHIEDIDTLGMTATVQAGVILENLQHLAADQGVLFPLDFGARGSCTIGGNLACNAGGNSVIRYGVARELCLGLEAVLADGTVLSQMNRMTKNTSGFDLKQLFIGSEGTLGVIARAVVRLFPRLKDRASALVGVASLAQVLELLQRSRAELGAGLCAFEVMWANYLLEVRQRMPDVRNAVAGSGGEMPPFAALIEVEAHDGAAVALTRLLHTMLEEDALLDAAIAQSQAQAEEFWALRDAVGQLLQMYRRPMAFDVSLPLSAMQAYCAQVSAALAAQFPGMTALCFGHLGDGTLHYIVDALADADKEPIQRCVLEPLADHGGAVSAEHGIGVTKRDYLALCRSPTEIAQMRRLKSWLDPHDILNPGRVFN